MVGRSTVAPWRPGHQDLQHEHAAFKLGDVLQEIFEVQGLIRLGHFTIFFVAAVLCVSLHWQPNTGLFKGSVVLSQAEYGNNDWEQSSWLEVNSLPSGSNFLQGYVTQLLQDSSERVSSDESDDMPAVITIGQDAYVKNIVLFIQVSITRRPKPTDLGLPPDVCVCTPTTFYAEDSGSTCLCDLYVSNTTMEDTVKIVDACFQAVQEPRVMENVRMVGIDMRVHDGASRSSPRGNVAMFRTNFFVSKTGAFSRSILTYFAGSALYNVWSFKSYLHAACETFFLLRFASYVRKEVLSCVAAKTQAGKYVAYFTPWNVFDCVSMTLSFFVAFYYACFVLLRAPFVFKDNFLSVHDGYVEQFRRHMHMNIFIYLGTFNNLFIGCRTFQYMKFHPGLKVYTKLFSEMWTTLRDFLIFFVYLVVLIAASLSCLFEFSGGNPDFATFPQSLASLVRLTFGFYDYDAFLNESRGLGGIGPVFAELVFWVTVALAVVVSQNVVLAIVANAYDVVRTEGGQFRSDVSFATMVFRRILFFCKRIVYVSFLRRSWNEIKDKHFSKMERFWFLTFVKHAALSEAFLEYFTDSTTGNLVKGTIKCDQLTGEPHVMAVPLWPEVSTLDEEIRAERKSSYSGTVLNQSISVELAVDTFGRMIQTMRFLHDTQDTKSWVFGLLFGSSLAHRLTEYTHDGTLQVAVEEIYSAWVEACGSNEVGLKAYLSSAESGCEDNSTEPPQALEPTRASLPKESLPNSSKRWGFFTGGQNHMKLEMAQHKTEILQRVASSEARIMEAISQLQELSVHQ